MHVIDLEGNEYPLQATSTNDYEVNGNQSLTARITSNKVNDLFIDNISEMWNVVDHDTVEHKIIYAKKQGSGNRLTVDIKAEPLFFDVLKKQRIYERIDKHMLAAEAFTYIFNDTGFNFVLVDSFLAVEWEGFGEGEDKIATFKRALERYKAEFEIIGSLVYLKTLIGRDTDIMYRYRLNASNIIQEIDASNMWTFARGYGNYGDGEGGEDWQNAKLIREYTSPLADIAGIGLRHAPPIKDGNIKVVATMDEALKETVNESLKISVSADIHDLRKQNYPMAQSKVGDRVFLIDERIGLNEQVRVVAQSVTRDWKGSIDGFNITFGTPGLVKRHQSKLNNGIKRLDDLFNGRERLSYDVMPDAIKRASEALLGAMTELEVTELGIIARSVDNPNHLVIYNSAGLGVSTDGGQTFENAITYLGVNTNLLTAGDIHTNNIRIVGEDNYFFWNGEGLYAIDPNNINKFVRLNSNGMYIARGAMTIERPDGALFVQNGVPTFELNVQASDPPYRNLVSSIGTGWLETKETSNQAVNYYSFKHVGRYLRVYVLAGLSAAGIGNGAVVVSGPSGSNINEQIIVTNSNDNFDLNSHTLLVDLGIPTYTIKNFYLSIRTGRTDNPMRIRTMRVIQEG